MLKIKGTLIREERAKDPCPDDKVHRCGKDGGIKGSHCFMLDGKMVPHGMVSFYYLMDSGRGLKVYINPKKGHVTKAKIVRQIKRRMQKYYRKGICPKPGKIREVAVDLKYKEKRHKKHCFAIEVQHVHWIEKAWKDYSNGHPYDWNASNHPDHSPKGYLKFKKRVDKILSKEDKKILRKIGDSYKLGDLCWCNKKKRWYMVDMG